MCYVGVKGLITCLPEPFHPFLHTLKRNILGLQISYPHNYIMALLSTPLPLNSRLSWWQLSELVFSYGHGHGQLMVPSWLVLCFFFLENWKAIDEGLMKDIFEGFNIWVPSSYHCCCCPLCTLQRFAPSQAGSGHPFSMFLKDLGIFNALLEA